MLKIDEGWLCQGKTGYGQRSLHMSGKGVEMEEKKQKHYVYILECNDGTYYTGWTTCLERRLAVHNSGKGAKYTRSRGPVRLIYHEEFETKEEAMSREYAIKQLTRKQKEQLLTGRS